MHSLTPFSALAGGVLIGLSVSLLLAFNGNIAGISGIARRLIWGTQGRSFPWQATFLIGLVAGVAIVYAWAQTSGHVEWLPHARLGFPPALLMVGGLLTGFGTALANGCTSGHGVCGMARFSPRSFAATLTFVVTAMVATYLVRHVWGIA